MQQRLLQRVERGAIPESQIRHSEISNPEISNSLSPQSLPANPSCSSDFFNASSAARFRNLKSAILKSQILKSQIPSPLKAYPQIPHAAATSSTRRARRDTGISNPPF